MHNNTYRTLLYMSYVFPAAYTAVITVLHFIGYCLHVHCMHNTMYNSALLTIHELCIYCSIQCCCYCKYCTFHRIPFVYTTCKTHCTLLYMSYASTVASIHCSLYCEYCTFYRIRLLYSVHCYITHCTVYTAT